MISTRKLTISAMVVALYIVVLYVTQSVSFGAYQMRMVKITMKGPLPSIY